MSLYGQLSTYAPRIGRTSREDFLTEALADLLNRLPQAEQIKFCSDFLLSGLPNSAKAKRVKSFQNDAKSAAKLEWRSQCSIVVDDMHKRPDIILYANDKPLLIVENKIDAGFTFSENAEEEDAEEDILAADEPAASPRHKEKHQLELYQKWLSEKNADGIAILLTHLTSAPTPEEAPNLNHSTLSVVRWSTLYKYLRDEGAGLWRDSSPNAVTLVQEFTQFLKESDMTKDDVTAGDFAAARLFYMGDAKAHIDRAMQPLREQTKSLFKASAVKSWRRSCPTSELDGEMFLIWDGPEIKDGTGIYWGFYFSPIEEPWWGLNFDKPALHHEGAFLYLSLPKEKAPKKWPISDEWSFSLPPYSEDEDSALVLRTMPFSHFFMSPDGFNASFSHWVTTGLRDLLKLKEQIKTL